MTSENLSLKSLIYLEDMEELQRVFKRFDVNGNEKISSTELANVLNALGSDTSPKEIQLMMAKIDIDGDGYIDLQEFAEFHWGGSDGDTNNSGGMRELKDAFDLYNRDKNGLISAAELHMVLKSLGEKCSIHDCTRMISSVNVDERERERESSDLDFEIFNVLI